jgi:hypothetical protein
MTPFRSSAPRLPFHSCIERIFDNCLKEIFFSCSSIARKDYYFHLVGLKKGQARGRPWIWSSLGFVRAPFLRPVSCELLLLPLPFLFILLLPANAKVVWNKCSWSRGIKAALSLENSPLGRCVRFAECVQTRRFRRTFEFEKIMSLMV